MEIATKVLMGAALGRAGWWGLQMAMGASDNPMNDPGVVTTALSGRNWYALLLSLSPYLAGGALYYYSPNFVTAIPDWAEAAIAGAGAPFILSWMNAPATVSPTGGSA